MTFKFTTEKSEMKLMAVFVAQLVREGVTFRVLNDHGDFVIELTGGF